MTGVGFTFPQALSPSALLVEETQGVTLIETVGQYTYVGRAELGTASSAAAWRIKRIYNNGSEVQVAFADGNASYDNVWDNRASLSYP